MLFDPYKRDCYYEYLNPNYTKFMHTVLKMYAPKLDIYDKKEQYITYRYDRPSTWISSGFDTPWGFLTELFGDIEDNRSNIIMLRHFAMFLLKNGMFSDYWNRICELPLHRKITNIKPEEFISIILFYDNRCFNAHKENVTEMMKKWQTYDKKWQEILKRF